MLALTGATRPVSRALAHAVEGSHPTTRRRQVGAPAAAGPRGRRGPRGARAGSSPATSRYTPEVDHAEAPSGAGATPLTSGRLSEPTQDKDGRGKLFRSRQPWYPAPPATGIPAPTVPRLIGVHTLRLLEPLTIRDGSRRNQEGLQQRPGEGGPAHRHDGGAAARRVRVQRHRVRDIRADQASRRLKERPLLLEGLPSRGLHQAGHRLPATEAELSNILAGTSPRSRVCRALDSAFKPWKAKARISHIRRFSSRFAPAT